MVPGSLFDGELLDAPLTSQAADLSDNTNDMSDHLFNAILVTLRNATILIQMLATKFFRLRMIP